jgi:hypothetical protein
MIRLTRTAIQRALAGAIDGDVGALYYSPLKSGIPVAIPWKITNYSLRPYGAVKTGVDLRPRVPLVPRFTLGYNLSPLSGLIRICICVTSMKICVICGPSISCICLRHLRTKCRLVGALPRWELTLESRGFKTV